MLEINVSAQPITFCFNPAQQAVSGEGFACFVRMDLLQLANARGLQNRKSFDFNGNFNRLVCWCWLNISTTTTICTRLYFYGISSDL